MNCTFSWFSFKRSQISNFVLKFLKQPSTNIQILRGTPLWTTYIGQKIFNFVSDMSWPPRPRKEPLVQPSPCVAPLMGLVKGNHWTWCRDACVMLQEMCRTGRTWPRQPWDALLPSSDHRSLCLRGREPRMLPRKNKYETVVSSSLVMQ